MSVSNKISALLIGNVNVGKTTLFNWLSDKNQKEVSEKDSSLSYHCAFISGSENIIYDIPGFSGFMIQSEEEKLAIHLLLNKGINTLIQVLDAKNIRRSLALALQMMELNIPILLNLNMIDEAQSKGIIIDTRKLESKLGIPLIETIANERHGIDKLLSMVPNGKTVNSFVKFNDSIETAIGSLSSILGHSSFSKRALALLLLFKNNAVEKFIRESFGGSVLEKCRSIIDSLQKKHSKPLSLILSETYFFYASRLANNVIKKAAIENNPFRSALSLYSTRLFPGIPIAILVGIALFFFVGKFGAQFLVGLLEGKLFNGVIIPSLSHFLNFFHSPFITEFFCGEFGIVSVGLALSFGVVFPVLLTFYIFFGFLEDSGYLPRFSILLDKVFRKIGLNGKGVLPMIMGFSCITMAILMARMLDTKKEKIIVTMLLILGIPCAPLLSVMFVLFGKLHWSAPLVVFGIIGIQILLVGFILNLILPGKRGDFIMEVPVLRLPNFLLILKKATLRLKTFIQEAVPVFLITTIILFAFNEIGGLLLLRKALKPVVHYFLGLPAESVEIIIMTIIRREAGAALLSNFFDAGAFNGLQAVVMLLIMTFLLPCINAVIVIFKERGLKNGLGIIGFAFPYSLLIGGAVNFILTTLKVKF
jgi:ferrous iron transport protein B